MADPRKDTRYTGIDSMPLPYKYDGSIVFDRTKPGGSVQSGLAVKITGLNTVGLTTDGSRIEGKIETVESDGFCTVNTQGGMSLPAAGAIANESQLVGAANGQVRAAAAPGGVYAQAEATDAKNARGRVVDGSVAAAIQLIL
jgi:hypothetical protein